MDTSAIDTFAAEHHGLLTRAAAMKRGMSKATWYRAVTQGRLIDLFPGVARLPGAPVTREQAIAAAVLASAPGSLASHRSAAHLWGISRPDDDPVEIIVTSRTRKLRLPGVTIHRPRDTKDLKPVRKLNISTTNVLRLLCDLGAVDSEGVQAAVGHVVTARLASPVALRAAIDRHARRGRQGTPLVLECDGWEFHAKSPAQQERDAARDARLAEHGFITVRFTYHQIVRRPAEQARRILGVLRRWAPNVELGAIGPASETPGAQIV